MKRTPITKITVYKAVGNGCVLIKIFRGDSWQTYQAWNAHRYSFDRLVAILNRLQPTRADIHPYALYVLYRFD